MIFDTSKTLIEGLFKKGKMLEALNLLHAMIKEDCLFDINTCNVLINGFCLK